ncbi:hypothetical protein [Streptomyces sp. CB02400]|uniref:hypothetical protein n=1 Tax=Streptomyces sp. CB02400 TaxID=1703944 RepID=UPI000939B796|nr:hypothetical protein [Streptomyces sp. CB02400]OKJ91834.1 hypothetical protein AMK33_34740 [Streptomyces sp. CB02400]
MNHLLCGLAANPNLPPGLVDRLIGIADDDLAAELAARADLSRTQTTVLAARGDEIAARLAYEGWLTASDVDPLVQPRAALALLDQGAGRPEWARLLASDPDPERREKLAACPDLPPDVVATLGTDPEIRVVAELALWTTTPDTAARFAEHPHAEVRCAVAANEKAPPAVLAGLVGPAGGTGPPPARRCLVCDRERTPFVHDPSCPRTDCDLPAGASCDGSHESTVRDMRQRAVCNPATPVDAVLRFAEHPSMVMRGALAARPDLPAHVFRRLAEDLVPGVRAALAENPAIDEALMRVLATDNGHDVRRGLAHNPNVPLDVLTHLAGATRIGPVLLPRIAGASPAEIASLAASPVPGARMLVAARRDLPPGIRDALAADPDAKVVASVAPHPGLSEARLRAMADRHGGRVVTGVAANPDTPAELLEDLARPQRAVRRALRDIARHRNATARALLPCLADARARHVAAGHPALPERTIVELLEDDDRQVVEAAAANPSLPGAVMSRLGLRATTGDS